MTDGEGIELSEALRSGIAATLRFVDDAVTQIELWATGRVPDSVFTVVAGSLPEAQRAGILGEISRIREILSALKAALRVEEEQRSPDAAIRSLCSVSWSHLADLNEKRLRRYGRVPQGLGHWLEPHVNEITARLEAVLDALRG